MLAGTIELGRTLPAGLIEQQDGVAPGATAAISARCSAHGLGVAPRQDEAGAFALGDRSRRRCRPMRCADRAAPRPRAPLRPAPGDLVLLADPGFVAEPDLYAAGAMPLLACDLRQARRGSFFKSLDGALGLRMMPRAGRELAIAHRAQLAAERLLGDADPELLAHPLAQIDQPPAHHAVDRRDRPALDDRGQGRPLRVVQARRLARRLAVDQAVRAVGIELQHPVAHGLQRHAADPRRLGPGGAVVDLRQRQQPPRLRRMSRCQSPPPPSGWRRRGSPPTPAVAALAAHPWISWPKFATWQH